MVPLHELKQFQDQPKLKMSRISPNHKPIVVVTGASRGIGHAIVKLFYDEGWDVVSMARTPFSTVCPWAEGIVKHIQVDLADNASINQAIKNLFQLIGESARPGTSQQCWHFAKKLRRIAPDRMRNRLQNI